MNEVRLFPDHLTLQMPAPTTKADWVAKLKGVGINVPIEWNLIQIKAAWADYQETKKDSPAEIMKEELSGLRRASRKKADLQQYLGDMGVQVQSKETVAAMFSKGEAAIIQKYEPTGSETVGFGKYGTMTFEEVAENHQDYLTWCIKALSETDSPYWRMERLVKWASAQGYCKTMKTSGPVKSPHKTPGVSSTGYPTKTMISNWDDLPEMKAKAKAKAMMKPPEEIPLPQVDFDSDEEKVMMRKKIQQLEEENADLHRQHSRNKDRREM